MSARNAGRILALALALGSLPAPAIADAGHSHEAEDAGLHTAADEPRLERLTSQATARDVARVAREVTGDAAEVGRWGPVTEWPVVGVHVALLPNGMVLAYDSVGDRAAPDYAVHDHTRATVWDPATGEQTRVDVEGRNIFCSGAAHLPDGSLFVAGGTLDAELDGIPDTHVFDAAASAWLRGPDMAAGRWYPSVTPLRDGGTLITSGGPPVPEVRSRAGALHRLEGASLAIQNYPWLDVGPDGRAFLSGPAPDMRALDASGDGAWQPLGARDGMDRDYGSHVLYDVGKILVAGGGASSADARVIDINGPRPRVSPTSPMAFGRRQHNLTVLADGTVLATGGNSSGAELVDLDHGVYPAERWDPATGAWTTLAPAQVPRQYHSTALLLADGRVLAAGGGVCVDCDVVGYLAKNAEVFTPPYLFKHDGSGELAPRPVLTAAPAAAGYGERFAISTPDAPVIRKLALVRLGSVTHSVNMEQRYVPLAFTAEGGRLAATAPGEASLAPPGVYMLFAVDAHGVPSLARMLRLDAEEAPAKEAPAGDRPAAGAAGAAGAVGVDGATAARAARFVSLAARLVARRGRLRVRVRCLQSAACHGRLSVARMSRGRRTALLGARRLSVPGGRGRTVAVALRRGRAGRLRRVRVRVEFAGRDAAGAPRRVARTGTMRRR